MIGPDPVEPAGRFQPQRPYLDAEALRRNAEAHERELRAEAEREKKARREAREAREAARVEAARQTAREVEAKRQRQKLEARLTGRDRQRRNSFHPQDRSPYTEHDFTSGSRAGQASRHAPPYYHAADYLDSRDTDLRSGYYSSPYNGQPPPVRRSRRDCCRKGYDLVTGLEVIFCEDDEVDHMYPAGYKRRV